MDFFLTIANEFTDSYSISSRYEVGMSTSQIKSPSDETDLYNLVLHRFKDIHFTQEERRHYPVYDTVTEVVGSTASQVTK